jgi:predicted 3-demethylubiquinone-9 3-methyltransferase (glyoxalase superfamily)
MPKITPFLWFDTQAEEAANFYVALFPNSRITSVARYPSDSQPPAGPPGRVMTVGFELDGQAYTALNGGPIFPSPRRCRSSSTAPTRPRSTATGTP